MRHSSLHLYPQHVFSSKYNTLNHYLDVPYAFSHKAAAFYWLRDDALLNHKLNIWATPPCLSCDLAGEDLARKCDRYSRQEESLGSIQYCSRCERNGHSSSCVEQFEIRADGRYGNSEKSKSYKPSHWCREEQELRKTGLVWWKPMNLGSGDIKTKRVLV